jgi:hypothetical protein
MSSRKPHKCPVCKAKQPAVRDCDACENGVVWEPEVVEAVSSATVNGDALDLTHRPRGGE